MAKELHEQSSSTVLKIAAFIIIIAGMIFAKAIVVPFLIALFISIICAQPIYWLEKKKVPKGLAIFIVLLGMLSVFIGFGTLIGGSVASFSSNAPNYEATLKTITDTFLLNLNDYGIKVTHAQFNNMFERC